MFSRCEILLENYSKIINIEALTLMDMIKKDIIPSACDYCKFLSEAASAKSQFCNIFNTDVEFEIVNEVSELTYELNEDYKKLVSFVEEAKTAFDNAEDCAKFYCDSILKTMESARKSIDRMEEIIASDYWPYPTYSELLFNV